MTKTKEKFLVYLCQLKKVDIISDILDQKDDVDLLFRKGLLFKQAVVTNQPKALKLFFEYYIEHKLQGDKESDEYLHNRELLINLITEIDNIIYNNNDYRSPEIINVLLENSILSLDGRLSTSNDTRTAFDSLPSPIFPDNDEIELEYITENPLRFTKQFNEFGTLSSLDLEQTQEEYSNELNAEKSAYHSCSRSIISSSLSDESISNAELEDDLDKIIPEHSSNNDAMNEFLRMMGENPTTINDPSAT